MQPSEHCYELIKQFEGLQLRAYKPLPSEKYFTIGYGHYSPNIKKGQVITLQQAEDFLHEDVGRIACLLDMDSTNLEQHQFDALLSLIYNIGWFSYRYSMTRETVKNMHQKSSPLKVARRILLWVRADGKILLGLEKRRVMEANHFLGYEKFQLKDGKIIELDTTPSRDGK